MGFLEDIFVKAKSAANNIGNKAGKLVDVSKLNIELAEEKSRLRNKFEDIGKIVYSSMREENLCNKTLEDEFLEIDEINCRIEKLKKEVAILQNKTICRACGAHNSSDDFYCGKCGHTLDIKCTCKSECENEKKSDCDCDSQDNCSDDCDCSSED